MIKYVYSVYDEKAQMFMNVFTCKTDGEAMRLFSDECHNQESMFSKHPHDFELFKIGCFNDNDGSVVQDKKSLGTAASYKVDQHNVELLFPGKKEKNDKAKVEA